MEEFKHVWMLFASEARAEWKTDGRIGAMSAVMWTLYQSVVVKRGEGKSKGVHLAVDLAVPTLTYSH